MVKEHIHKLYLLKDDTSHDGSYLQGSNYYHCVKCDRLVQLRFVTDGGTTSVQRRLVTVTEAE